MAEAKQVAMVVAAELAGWVALEVASEAMVETAAYRTPRWTPRRHRCKTRPTRSK